MFKLLKEIRHYKLQCVAAPFFKMLEAFFELLVPLVVADIIDNGIYTGDKLYILSRAGIMALLGIVGLICSISAQYFAAKAAVGFASRIRHNLFAKIQHFSYTETDTVGTSTMITRLSSDVNQVQSGVNLALRLLLRSPFIVFGSMIMAFTIDPKSALTFVVVIPLLSLVVFGIMLISIPLFKKVQHKLDLVLGKTRENLTGARVIRAFGLEEEEISRFDTINRDQTRMQRVVGRVSALLNPLTYIMINFAVIALLWIGGHQVDAGVISQGKLVSLYNYMSQILVELIKLASLIISITKAVACGNRIQKVLEIPDEVSPAGAPETRTEMTETAVSFDQVSLCYKNAGEDSLSGISFSVKKGETFGIIGGTGSGKTSLVNLIPRFYDAKDGNITVFGQDIKTIPLSDLRKKIGIVPQKAVLFKGTIRSNLLFGNENATDETLWEALEAAQAADFVRAKEGGLDTQVLQNGKNFSGGQRQRLTIARALVRHPEILILDDSSSALDYATDASLRQALRNLPYHPTVFLVSQRTASLLSADQILVLEDGKAVGLGNHDSLLQTCDIYREIHESQFEKKEGDAV